MDDTKIWVTLKEMGVPQHLIVLMCYLYYGQEATIRAEYRETEWFPRDKAFRQACILSPSVFNLYTEHVT